MNMHIHSHANTLFGDIQTVLSVWNLEAGAEEQTCADFCQINSDMDQAFMDDKTFQEWAKRYSYDELSVRERDRFHTALGECLYSYCVTRSFPMGISQDLEMRSVVTLAPCGNYTVRFLTQYGDYRGTDTDRSGRHESRG